MQAFLAGCNLKREGYKDLFMENLCKFNWQAYVIIKALEDFKQLRRKSLKEVVDSFDEESTRI